jgi:hypothetical protein
LVAYVTVWTARFPWSLEQAVGVTRRPDESEFVFNIVWTGTMFTYLRTFAASQIAQSEARFRYVANGCPPEQVDELERFAAEHPDRVIEVLDVSEEMVAHGVALDRVRAQRDDGPWFCLIDPDIKANAPYLAPFCDLLGEGYSAVTSGTEVWSDDNVIPEGHLGVPGESFYDRNGFVFGSPHLALYDRAALDDTTERWGIGLGSAGPELSDAAKARMAEMGHDYKVYDTGKIVNALFQADGHRLVHEDLPQLIHIGGLSHYMSPAGYVTLKNGEVEPEWVRWGITDRFQVSRFTSLTLHALRDGDPAPAIPDGVDPAMTRKLELVQREMADVLVKYAEW